MSTKQPRYRYSWKKPWLFDDIHLMRKYITEREAYRKLKLLERHSAFKKPYWNLRGHQFGELVYSSPGYPPSERPGGGGWVPPSGDDLVGGCGMACNGGILDCKGGMCDDITCICGIPPYVVEVIDDPTGRAYGVSGLRPMVCLEKISNADLEYAVVKALVIDAIGQTFETEHPVVNCSGCCDAFTLSGNSTQNPGTTWEGTLDPPCPEATCEVSSNSGCTLGCSMSSDGSTVSVVIGAAQCGTFTVTVTYSQQDCEEISASLVVRINNTGQGGAWASLEIHNYDSCSDICSVGCGSVNFGPCTETATGYKYGWQTINPCDSQFSRQCKGCNNGGCDAGEEQGRPPCTTANNCEDAGIATASCPIGQRLCLCTLWRWQKCEWECTC